MTAFTARPIFYIIAAILLNICPLLTVRIGWAGRILDGPLARKIKASEALWVIETGQSSDDTHLHIVLPKSDQHYWRSVFEGGLEKSHIEVELRCMEDSIRN
jgi:hypothetical protein